MTMTASPLFPNLVECLRFIERQYPQHPRTVRNREYRTNSFHDRTQPRYLFRGEPSLYPTTTSSLHRLIHSEAFPDATTSEIRQIVAYVESLLIKLTNLPSLLIRGYCQHYGLPTEFIDFTRDLETAALFAC